MTQLTGSIVALATPFSADGAVDYPALRKLIDWHVAEKTDCICVVGTTGESPTVDVDEHCEIIRVAVEQSAKRVPIMAGCGANSTAEAVSLAQFAQKVGAQYQLQVVPYYNKPTAEGQYQHFKAIAEQVPGLPMMLYNVPGRTAVAYAARRPRQCQRDRQFSATHDARFMHLRLSWRYRICACDSRQAFAAAQTAVC